MTEPFYSAPPNLIFSGRITWAISMCCIILTNQEKFGLMKRMSWNKDRWLWWWWRWWWCDDDAFAVAPLWPLVSMENKVQMTDPMLLHRGRDKKHQGFQTVSVKGGRSLFWSVNASAVIMLPFVEASASSNCCFCVVAANQRLWRSSTVYSDQPKHRCTPHCHGTSKHTSGLMMRPLDFMTLFKQWATLA